MRAIVFDIDDTLCDTRATRDGIARPLDVQCQRWLSAAPIANTVAIARDLAAEGYAIILVTARHESIHAASVEQVESFGIPVAAIYGRKAGDNRVDHKVKTDCLNELMSDGYVPVAAYDDKQRNLDVFSAAGIATVLVSH
jgi:phosphoglycolate phosphatase-like HAD superfamily hydrolase